MKKYLLFAALIALSACAPSPKAIEAAIAETQAAWTPISSQTPYPTQTQWVVTKMITSIVKETVLVFPTETPTPVYTPTKTGTPTNTPNIAATTTSQQIAKLQRSFRDGNYLIGVDIAPGVWRNDGSSDNCYWTRNTRTGDIIDNYLGAGGGTAYIGPNDFSFRSERCNTWTYLGPP